MATMDLSRPAIEGGAPVRDTQVRPWPTWPVVGGDQWLDKLEPALREIYFSRVEGLGGSWQERFSEQFAIYCATKHCCLLSHGTEALSAALAAALDLDGFGDGGEVIVPNYTFIASASAVLDMHCEVALVDVDPQTFTLCPDAVRQAIRPGRTRAIMAVHIAGQPCDMKSLIAIAEEHGLMVIEDCAQAHGAIHDGKPVGGLAHAAGFSFQSSKNLCSGEGGAVTSNDTAIHNRVVGLMNAGREPRGARWKYARIGWNYRPSEYVAAVLSVRLDDLEKQTEHRTRMADYLSQQLSAVPGITPPRRGQWCTRHAYHLYPMLIDESQFGGRSRDEIVEAVNAEGITVSSGYTDLLSNQSGLKQLAADHVDAVRVEPCPVTEDVCRRSIWVFQEMLLASESDMDDIVAAFAKLQRAFAG